MATSKRTRKPRPARPPTSDPLEADFGPGLREDESAGAFPGGPMAGIACAGEGCLLKPLADLVSRFALSLARVHAGSLSRAAFSGLELMKALRDFLDEEIALAERSRGAGRAGRGYVKISVE